MADLREVLQKHVDDGAVPGAVALVARGDQVEVAVVGSVDVEGTAPMARDAIFRAASITKMATAAAVLTLVEDGRIALDSAVSQWLPELSSPMVVRTPSSPVDDVVPAARPITVADLLSFRAGYGFPDDFSLPAVQDLFTVTPAREPLSAPPPDEWMVALSRIPMLHQPGEAWLYNTCSDIQGVLIARVSGQPFPDFLAERVFAPLGMTDTAFHVPAAKTGRLPSYYQPAESGQLELVDRPDGQWSRVAPFPSGAGGSLVTTLDDWYAFERMLFADGVASTGRRVLNSASVRLMMTDCLTPAQRDGSRLFLEGQGWGCGGSVDVARIDPWNVPGRFGWTGGTGTAAHVVPETGLVSILFTQVAMTGPTPPDIMREFWGYAAGA